MKYNEKEILHRLCLSEDEIAFYERMALYAESQISEIRYRMKILDDRRKELINIDIEKLKKEGGYS